MIKSQDHFFCNHCGSMMKLIVLFHAASQLFKVSFISTLVQTGEDVGVVPIVKSVFQLTKFYQR